jgi:MFS family permease
MTTPWTLAPLIVAPVAGALAPRVGTRALIVTGCLLQAAAVGWLSLTMSQELQYLVFLPAFLCGGIGMGLVFAPISTATLANMSAADNAKASGTNATVREIGVALGVAVMTSRFLGAGGTFTATGYVSAAAPAIAVGAVVLVGAAVAALFLPPGRGTGAVPERDPDPGQREPDAPVREPAAG